MAQLAFHAKTEWRNGGRSASRALSLFVASETQFIFSYWHVCSGKNFSCNSCLSSLLGTAKGSRPSHTTVVRKRLRCQSTTEVQCQSAWRNSCICPCKLLSPLEASRIITGEPGLFGGCRSASEVTETEVHFATATSRGVRAPNYKHCTYI